jgi:hypothetical protein
MIVRSYRRVFEVDRRIYRVDRWALPVPGGIPLRAVGYFALSVVAMVVLGALPLVGELVGMLSPPLRYVVVPIAIAVFGTQAAPDGRSAHRFAADWLRFRLRARRRSAGRVLTLEDEAVRWDGELPVRWDADGAELHRGRVRGPARVTFNVPVDMHGLEARPAERGRTGDAIVLGGGTTLEVRP